MNQPIDEFSLISDYFKELTGQQNVAVGIGDDAAIIDIKADKQIAVATDTLVASVHFPDDASAEQIATRALCVNLSDMAAMGATPKWFTLALTMPKQLACLEWLQGFSQGLARVAGEYNVSLIGGDTTASTSGLMISITATGRVEKEKASMRSGAKDNDLIVISGDVGGAYMGLQILEREKQVFIENPDMQPELGGHEYILERQLKPEARKDIVDLLHNLQVQPTSMIDISDGLSSEILHLSKASNHQFNIYENKIPIDPSIYTLCEEFNMNTTTVGLNGGEDYELLFTIKQEDHDKLENHPDIHFIGHTHQLDKGNVLVTKNQNVVELKAQGWNHLSEEK